MSKESLTTPSAAKLVDLGLQPKLQLKRDFLLLICRIPKQKFHESGSGLILISLTNEAASKNHNTFDHPLDSIIHVAHSRAASLAKKANLHSKILDRMRVMFPCSFQTTKLKAAFPFLKVAYVLALNQPFGHETHPTNSLQSSFSRTSS